MPVTPVLPDEAFQVKCVVGPPRSVDGLVPHGEREVHQGVVIHDLPCRDGRGLGTLHAGRERTGNPHLRQGATPIGTDGSEHEQAGREKRDLPYYPRRDWYREVVLLGSGGRMTVERGCARQTIRALRRPIPAVLGDARGRVSRRPACCRSMMLIPQSENPLWCQCRHQWGSCRTLGGGDVGGARNKLRQVR